MGCCPDTDIDPLFLYNIYTAMVLNFVCEELDNISFVC